jgi:hypothetical protein
VAVPSVFHNSVPETPSDAVKYNVVPITRKFSGEELELPSLISLTRTVPAAVPFVFHNSMPDNPSDAVKYNVVPMRVNWSR